MSHSFWKKHRPSMFMHLCFFSKISLSINILPSKYSAAQKPHSKGCRILQAHAEGVVRKQRRRIRLNPARAKSLKADKTLTLFSEQFKTGMVVLQQPWIQRQNTHLIMTQVKVKRVRGLLKYRVMAMNMTSEFCFSRICQKRPLYLQIITKEMLYLQSSTKRKAP